MFSFISQPLFFKFKKDHFLPKAHMPEYLTVPSFYIIKRVLVKLYIPKYAFIQNCLFLVYSRFFTPNCRLKGVILVKSSKACFYSILYIYGQGFDMPKRACLGISLFIPPPQNISEYMHSVQHELIFLYHMWTR